MPTALQVFGQPASAEVARVLTCLFEKNLDFQIIRIDSFKGVHKVPEFLKLKDPSGQVTFRDGDVILVDSREICRYVARAYADKGNRALFGTGSLERAAVEQWLQTEAQSFDPPSSTLVFNLAYAPLLKVEPDEAAIARSMKRLNQVLDVYEQRLSETEYLAGDSFTLADLAHLPNAHRLAAADDRCRALFASRKKVLRWWEAISERKSWKRVVQMQREQPYIV